MADMTAEQIRALMRQRFAAPTHSIFFEVMDATGARHTGYCDAIAMSMWPSHGLEIEGFEIKVSRHDWWREKVKPEKAEKFASRCDRWWLITCAGVVEKENEIPPGWGWMLATPDGITIKRPANKNPAPVPLDKVFVAGLLRAAGRFDQKEVEAIVQKRVEDLRTGDEDRIKRGIENRRGEDVADAKIMSGVRKYLAGIEKFHFMHDEAMIEAIVAVYKSGVSGTYGGLLDMAKKMEDFANKIRDSHKSLGLPAPAPEKKRRKKT